LDEKVFTNDELIIWSSDEIIFHVKNEKEAIMKKLEAEEYLTKFFPNRKGWYKLEAFYLRSLGYKHYSVKEVFENDTIIAVFKGCNSSEYIQCFKHYHKISLEPIDFCLNENKMSFKIPFPQ